MYVLSCVLPPTNGAAYGKATVFDPEPLAETFDLVSGFMTEHFGSRPSINLPGSLAYLLVNTDTGTDVYDPATGGTFRLDPVDRAPNACPCCGRLVKFGDHALAGSDDAYCDGCFTRGDTDKIACAPQHTAHANPWSTDASGARWHMGVIIDHDGETGDDDRYARDATHEMWDAEDNALIAWPLLTPDQIIAVSITEITELTKES